MLVVVPLAIPDFVVSFGWASLWTWIHGFRGAVIVMTLAVYPLVYLPVAASLRGADPGQEEVARSLGSGRVRTFVRITLGQARGAILGGCLLVAMVMLAEYGAFEIVGYQTFTTEIFTEINVAFSLPGGLRAGPGAGAAQPDRAGGGGQTPRPRAGQPVRGAGPAGVRAVPAGQGPDPRPGRPDRADRAVPRRPGRLRHLLDDVGRAGLAHRGVACRGRR